MDDAFALRMANENQQKTNNTKPRENKRKLKHKNETL